MAMKKGTSFVRAEELASDNADRIASANQTADQKKANAATVAVIAQMLDAIAKHEATHFTIGMPRAGGSFLVTANMPDGSKQFVGFKDVYEFGPTVLVELFVM